MARITSFQVDVTTKLRGIDCWNCGGVYAITERRAQKAQDEGAHGWYCPYCQRSTGYRTTTEDTLRKQITAHENALALERSRHDQTQAALKTTERRRRAERGARTRLVNRVKAGVCIVCTRHFENLERHMTTKHAALVPDEPKA